MYTINHMIGVLHTSISTHMQVHVKVSGEYIHMTNVHVLVLLLESPQKCSTSRLRQ